MKTKTLLIVSLFFVGIVANAQSTFDKLLFEEAQTEYKLKNYEGCLLKIKELENRKVEGPLILHLKIIALYSIKPEELGISRIAELKENADYYIKNYDNDDFSSQFKEVYAISKKLDSDSIYSLDTYINKIDNKDMVNLFFLNEQYVVLTFGVFFGLIILFSYILFRKKNYGGMNLSFSLIIIIVLVTHFFIPYVYVVQDCGKIEKSLLIIPQKTSNDYKLFYGNRAYLINASTEPIYINRNGDQHIFQDPLTIARLESDNLSHTLYFMRSSSKLLYPNEASINIKYHSLNNNCLNLN